MSGETVKKPNFFVIGTVKGGTTSLHHYLDQHPEVYTTPIKETNFFARNDILFDQLRKDFKVSTFSDIKTYVNGTMDQDIFRALVREWDDYLQLYKNATTEKALGEVCPSYLFCPGSVVSMKELLPEAKLIAMLRNPVDRAYSAYMMNYRDGKTMGTDFIQEAQDDLNAKPRGWGITFNYLDLGFYGTQIAHVYQHFPKEQVKVYLYDDYKKDPIPVLQDIFRFLGVDDSFTPDTSKRLNVSKAPRFKSLNRFLAQNPTLRQFIRSILPASVKKKAQSAMFTDKQLPKITEEQRQWLIDFYRDEVKKLEGLIGRDLGMWLV